MSNRLTARQQMFCREYIKDLNAKQAALRAGYSSKTAKEIGAENLSKPHLAQYIQELKAVRENKVEIDAEYVLRRLKEIDELDVLDIFNETVTEFKPLSQWPREWRTSVSGIDIASITSGETDGKSLTSIVSKIKWPDKVKNLEMIGRHVSVKAFEKDQQTIVNNAIMPVPTCDSIDDWESIAKSQQEQSLQR